jgi:urease accessory protein
MTAERPHLANLFQLVSPSLPIGAYAYSQGLERALADGTVSGEAEVAGWLECQLRVGLGRWDLPLLLRLHACWAAGDEAGALRWSRFLQAGRETAELLAEDRQQGQALARLLDDLELADGGAWRASPDATLAALFARAAVVWDIPATDCAWAHAWAWADGQIAAAIKLVPLGQTAGQRLLLRLGQSLPAVIEAAGDLDEDDLGGAMPGLAVASARHETQYSRLFRS